MKSGAFTFAKRCAREILRDPLNVAFGLGFPVVLLLLLTAIQANVPIDLFKIDRLAPGISVFGLSFMTLFSATLVARDRESALLERLYTTPLSSPAFIFGYLMPLVPIAIAQGTLTYALAILLGLSFSVNILFAIAALLPISIFYISLGILCGSIMNVKQVGGICGALLTNLSAWLSGIWFDIELVGGAFTTVARLLPFLHAVELERAVICADWERVISSLLPVAIYSLAVMTTAILLFLRQMKKR